MRYNLCNHLHLVEAVFLFLNLTQFLLVVVTYHIHKIFSQKIKQIVPLRNLLYSRLLASEIKYVEFYLHGRLLDIQYKMCFFCLGAELKAGDSLDSVLLTSTGRVVDVVRVVV